MIREAAQDRALVRLKCRSLDLAKKESRLSTAPRTGRLTKGSHKAGERLTKVNSLGGPARKVPVNSGKMQAAVALFSWQTRQYLLAIGDSMRTPTTIVRDLAIHKVVTVASNTTLRDCAQAMREEHVGSVVLVDPGNPRPVGIITDRDIVVEAVAVGLDVTTLTAGDIAAKPVVTVRDDEDVLDALARMRENGVRRLPVTASNGHLAGVLSLDDLLGALSEQFDSIVRVMIAERTKEGATRR